MSPSATDNNGSAAAIEQASEATEQVTESFKLQQKLDKFGEQSHDWPLMRRVHPSLIYVWHIAEDHFLNLTSSGYSSTGKQFYSDNRNSFSSSVQAIAGASNWNTIEENINGFAESSRFLISLLDEVAKIHPFVGGPWQYGIWSHEYWPFTQP